MICGRYISTSFAEQDFKFKTRKQNNLMQINQLLPSELYLKMALLTVAFNASNV